MMTTRASNHNFKNDKKGNFKGPRDEEDDLKNGTRDSYIKLHPTNSY